MSWDVFVQDLPSGVTAIDEIPEDFIPGPIGAREDIVSGISRVAPTVDFSHPSLGTIETARFSIEINLPIDDPVTGFAFHVRGGDDAAHLVADILDELGLSALDPQAPGGVFSRDSATSSLETWRQYRDEVLDS